VFGPRSGIVSIVRKTLRRLAVILPLAALAVWLATGASRSIFTRTSDPIKTPDPVTGLDRIEWKPAFVPGLDFLGASALTAAVLAGASFLFRKKKTGA